MNWRSGLRVPALALAVIASTGCGQPAAPTSHSAAVEDCRGTESASLSPSLSPGVSYTALTINNQLRDYRLFRPQTMDSGVPVPLVIVMPAPSADADTMESLIHFDDEASKVGFLVASPNGCGLTWSYSPGPANTADEGFVRDMIQQLRTRFPVSNIYATSASGGSRILYRLACDLADELTAIADVAGTMILKDGCRPTRAISILEMHGTADDASPWAGGGPNGSYPVEAVNQRWRTLDGCASDPAMATMGITVSSIWTCRARAIVRLDKVIGGKHTWFGSGDSDAVPGEPIANDVIWSFFSSVAGGVP
jgi:polyhydroxybutyrate depolymerase